MYAIALTPSHKAGLHHKVFDVPRNQDDLVAHVHCLSSHEKLDHTNEVEQYDIRKEAESRDLQGLVDLLEDQHEVDSKKS